MEDEAELALLLRERIEAGTSLQEKISEPPYSKLKGVSKLQNRVASELKFLQGLQNGRKPLEKKYIDTSNITHYANIVASIDRYVDVTSVYFTFSILDTETEETLKHNVDIVSRNGSQWVKIISRSAKGVCMDWLAGSSKHVFEQAESYLEMAERFQQNFNSPEVVFDFIAGVPDLIANKLRSMDVTVKGEMIPMDSICNLPEDFKEMLTEDLNSAPTSDSEFEHLPNDHPINLDVTTVFVLISNLTHPGGTNHRYDSPLLRSQVEMEKEKPARQALLDQIEGRKWIICRTAFENVEKIMSTVAGEEEKRRKEELFKRVRVVEDKISERTEQLSFTDRIKERSKIIFGTGDFYQAITATANKHFVASAHHQGVRYDVIIHESRALSEQKELPL